MLQELNPKKWIPRIALLIMISGCDERVTQVTREAADRQAQQNTAMAELNKEVASGTRGLVTADASARKEIVAVHRQLQAERTRLDTGWNALELERRRIASQRRTESMLVPVTQLIGGLALIMVLLGFCWRAVVAARSSDSTDARLNELLIREILPDEPPLIPIGRRVPNLLDHTPPHDRPVE